MRPTTQENMSEQPPPHVLRFGDLRIVQGMLYANEPGQNYIPALYIERLFGSDATGSERWGPVSIANEDTAVKLVHTLVRNIWERAIGGDVPNTVMFRRTNDDTWPKSS